MRERKLRERNKQHKFTKAQNFQATGMGKQRQVKETKIYLVRFWCGKKSHRIHCDGSQFAAFVSLFLSLYAFFNEIISDFSCVFLIYIRGSLKQTKRNGNGLQVVYSSISWQLDCNRRCVVRPLFARQERWVHLCRTMVWLNLMRSIVSHFIPTTDEWQCSNRRQPVDHTTSNFMESIVDNGKERGRRGS